MSATIKVTGDAVVFTSAHKLEDWLLVKKYAKDKLALMGGEDNKDQIFGVDVVDGHGCINKSGAYFSNKTKDANGCATITKLIETEGDVKEYIADEFGAALVNLGKIEETIPTVVEEIKAQRKAIIDNIAIA